MKTEIMHIGTVETVATRPLRINGHPIAVDSENPTKGPCEDERGIDQSVSVVDSWGWSEGDTLLLISNEFGLDAIVTGSDETSAWEEWLDNQETVSGDDELEEIRSALENDGDLPEGYEFQANATGSGIVHVGHYVTFQALTIG